MPYHPRFERADVASLNSTRARNEELWLINNSQLEEAILAYAAKYAERYNVALYALAIEGNHIHTPSFFPLANRADFMRDFNASVARAVARHCPTYPGGTFWARRYSTEVLPLDSDIEKYFFYAVLQAVKDGLVERISEYPGYNCFHDAIYGIEREYTVINWTEYNAKKRYDPSVKISDFSETVTLKYERLPGYEHLSQADYAKLMLEKLEQHRAAIVNERKAKGLGFLGRDALLKMKPGTRPKNPKKSTRYSHRPRVLSECNETRAREKERYFNDLSAFKDASRRYRLGERDVIFPPGTYKPHIKVPPKPPD